MENHDFLEERDKGYKDHRIILPLLELSLRELKSYKNSKCFIYFLPLASVSLYLIFFYFHFASFYLILCYNSFHFICFLFISFLDSFIPSEEIRLKRA